VAPPRSTAGPRPRLDIPQGEGILAIRAAHTTGPGALLDSDGRGLPLNGDIHLTGDLFEDVKAEWKKEALWLILAMCSRCVETGYADEMSIVERMQQVALAVSTLTEVFANDDLVNIASHHLENMQKEVVWTKDINGIPLTTNEYGHYLGYKLGYPVVAVQDGGLTFYGTPPTTTLAQEGVAVDKVLSPHFGIVFSAK
jgi:hypothetical protein